MAKEICISSTPHETRLAILEDDQLTEIYYERENEYTLAGSIYKGRVTRVLPGMQSAFVDVGLERDAFLYVTDFLEEAGESADFERVATPQARTENKAREPRESRESREAREPRQRPEQKVEYQTESNQHAVELTVSPPLPEEGREEETDGSGTRRWRGRRGRRRSGARSAAPRPGGLSASAGEVYPAAPGITQSEPPFESVESIDMLPYDDTVPFMEATSASDRSVAERGGSEREPRQSSREPKTGRRPGSENPSAIALPGESLSKYGAKPAASAPAVPAASASAATQHQARPNYVAPKPRTLVDAPMLLDGGLLAGESLSRHRRSTPPQSTAFSEPVQTSAEPAAPEEWTPLASDVETPSHEMAAADDPLADAHASHEHAPNTHIDAHADAHTDAHTSEAHATAPPLPGPRSTWDQRTSIPPVGYTAEATESYASLAEHSSVPGPEQHASPAPRVEDSHPAEPGTFAHHGANRELHEIYGVAADDTPHAEEAPASEPHEAEPTDASASHKVDPSAPSEFRLPWFSDKSKAKEPAEAAAPTPAPGGDEGRSQENHSPGSPSEGARETASSPYEGEAAHREGAPATDTREPHAGGVEAISGFAPGAGLLEEEIIEEEEYDFAPLHAHADEHELDELEEETLDQQMGGAELGEMVREAALDQRINTPFGSAVSTDDEAEDDVEESAADLAEAEAYGEEISEDAPAAADESNGAAAPTRRVDENRRGGRGRQGNRRGRNGSGNSGGRGGRQNTQASDLPIISDLLKQGQEILVQIAKEPIAKKGARITSHIALPGRFLVFMPTVNHVGVSRKISSDEERQRLKRILISEKGDAIGGFIVRTAAATASEEDLRADIRFLLSLWNGIKERSDTAKAPALIYHDLNLVERVLRDQVSDNFSSIWVDSEVEYERIVRFLQRFQPSLVRRVKLYTKETPLFEQFGIQDEISKALKSKVWLKSGGSIVINQTEALVAIDINTGKYVGKTARLEDTILRTNLDAIPEMVRQIRLRDLGGIIVIDFIDMDERKNRHRVMLALEEALKTDRAPSKVLQFNDFGLVAITRKRVKQSLERTLSVQCEVCTGTGMVKSPTTVCNEIYIEMRKMQRTFESPDVLLRVNPEVVKTLKGSGARWLTEMEEMISKNIIVKSDPALHPEHFDIH